MDAPARWSAPIFVKVSVAQGGERAGGPLPLLPLQPAAAGLALVITTLEPSCPPSGIVLGFERMQTFALAMSDKTVLHLLEGR